MNGAELFVACLEAGGVEVIYGVPGEENTDLMLALQASDIRFVLTRHEQAAAFMASVHGRLIGRPAGCLSTLGPGATNLITGVADANLDFAPLVAITAQAGRGRKDRSESHQVIDLDELFRSVTKSSQTLTSAQSMPGQIAEALQLAVTEKPGAVHLSLPEDLAGETVEGKPVHSPAYAKALPSPKMLVDALKQITAAKQPLIICGAGVVRSGAADEVRILAEAINVPVATTFMASGILPPDHPLTLFTIGQPYEDHIDGALASTDLIIAIGVDPIEYPPSKLTDGGSIPVVSFAETRSPADAGWPLLAEVIGALPSVVKSLTAGLTKAQWDVPDDVKTAQTAMRAARADVCTGPNDTVCAPVDILRTIEAQLGETDIVLSGVGTHKMSIARLLAPKHAGQVIIGNGLAGMGLALPGAMAAADLSPDRRVLAICGDGDVMMNVQDMETARRLNLPMVVMVWEDGGYGLIKAKQEQAEGTHTDLSFGNPDWHHLAKAFGWTHLPVERFGDLAGALDKAWTTKGPVLMPIKVCYDEPMADRTKAAA